MHSILAIVASSNGESPIAIIAFAIAAWWIYFKMDKRDKDHEIKMKKLDKDKEK